MKKALFILTLLLLTFSCQKEDIQPNEPTPIENCSCGRVVYTGEMEVQWGTNNPPQMDLKVRNNCTDVVKTFKVNYTTSIYIGDEWCDPNNNTW